MLAGALALPLTNSRAQGADPTMAPIGKDSFAVRLKGAPTGVEVHAFTRTSSGYRYSERIFVPGIMQRTVTVEFDSSLRVRRTASSGSIGNRQIQSQVTYQGLRAHGTAIPLKAATARIVTIDTVLPARAVDGLALYPVVLARRLAIGAVDTVVLFDTDEMTITRQTIRTVGREQLTLPAGSVPALRVELSTSQLPVTLWVTESRPHRLLKIGSANGETVRVQ